MSYDRVLELLSSAEHPGLFVLGAFARRVTVYSQQVRAINLIDAIHYYRRPLKDVSIAIVGAGAAGLTAAARALQYGAKITLFERNPDVMSIQTNCHHRWLHPTIYDWPFFTVGGDADKADLPVMDWTAEEANLFATDQQTQWRAMVRRHGADIRQFIPADVTAVVPMGRQYQLQYCHSVEGKKLFDSGTFDLVVLATGFGLEPEGIGRNSYWDKDPWDQIARSDQVVLVAGYGDGALTDLMRVCLIRFEHRLRLIEVINSLPDDVLSEIRRIESDSQATSAAFLSAEYRKLFVPEVQQILEPYRNTLRTIVLTGHGPDMFDPRASALNRLIASQLLLLKAFRHIEMKAGEEIEQASSEDAVIKRIESEAGVKFTHFILRFGPDPSITKIATPPPVVTVLKERWRAIRPHKPDDDPTRARLWTRFKPISEDIDSCCVIFRSLNSSKGHDELLSVVDDAIRSLPKDDALIKTVVAVSAQNCLRSDEALSDTVRALCRAPIAVFALGTGMGQNNPTGMLLLGVRAAVRRGLTFVIHEGQLDATDWSTLPFNLKELQVVSLGTSPESAEHLANFIASGLRMLRANAGAYRDLPAFEVVRRPERLTPQTELGKLEVFVLCPFSAEYTQETWNRLRLLLRRINLVDCKIEAKRVSDYSSPVLVGERLYELMRFAGLCVVDWTAWRANVFFEFGVRLAVNPAHPICVFNRDSIGTLDDEKKLLMERFSPSPYTMTGAGGDDPDFRASFTREMERAKDALVDVNPVYQVAQNNVRLEQEFGHCSHDQQVAEHVRSTLGPDIVRAGRLPLLYGGNSNLSRQVWRGIVEELKAADLLLAWKIDHLTSDAAAKADLLKARQSIQSKLLAILELKLDREYQKFGEDIDDDD
jgi:hypothetical protein